MQTIFCPATADDAEAITKIHVETWQSHYKGLIPDAYLNTLSEKKWLPLWTKSLTTPKEKSKVFVSKTDGKVSGFSSARPSRDEDATPETGEIATIYINQQMQGHGIGSLLMKVALNFLKEQGFTKATLWVLKTNSSAIEFYKAKGWKADGKEKIDKIDFCEIEEVRYAIDL